MEYVGGRRSIRGELAMAYEALGALIWIARTGKLRSTALPEGWLTVKAAQELPLLDTSWMDEPWSKAKFTAWVQ